MLTDIGSNMGWILFQLGVSLVLALVSQAEIIYSTQSPLDLDAGEQQKW